MFLLERVVLDLATLSDLYIRVQGFGFRVECLGLGVQSNFSGFVFPHPSVFFYRGSPTDSFLLASKRSKYLGEPHFKVALQSRI